MDRYNNKNWIKQLRYNPVKPLLESNNAAVCYFAKRDLLSDDVPPLESVWELEEPRKILKKQKASGYWESKSRNREKAPAVNYDLFETFKQFSKLVDMFEFNKVHESVHKAAEYIFSCQTEEGDIRGIIGNQYAPYYTGLIMSLLIRAGYEDDSRIEKGFEWLLSVRQNDGGWVIGSPGGFGRYSKEESMRLTTHNVGTKRDFDKTRPFTHSGTGMVIRAFAVHSKYRKSEEARTAAILLKSQFFKEDNSPSYKAVDHWVNFKYPFFWTDLVSALDSVSLIGIGKDDGDVQKALTWLSDNQQESGLWKHSYSKIHKTAKRKVQYEKQLWISLAICRILRRYYGD
jgi:hypothetical protein